MSVKAEREKMLRSGAPLSKHSLNQERLYNAIRMEKKAFGGDRKREKSLIRRQKKEDEQTDFFEQLQEMKFSFALGDMVDGKADSQDVFHVATNMSQHERMIEIFTTKKGTEVTIAIVDFTRQDNVSARKDVAA